MKHVLLYSVTLISATVILLSFRFLDEDYLKQLKTKLTEFNQRYPEERVYLQFDKSLYKPGEDIWFKAYLVSGTTLAPSLISTVMYVELVDPRGTVIKKSELYVEEGTAHGDFQLDPAIAGGQYTIRAFTRWMQNFPEENYFTKQLTVQKVITPRLLLKVDFGKKAYGKNDFVTAQLKVRNLKDEPLAHAEVNAQLKLEGNDYQSKIFQTNAEGEVDVTFQLPDDLNTTDGLLQMLVSRDGVEESISRSVPIVLNKIQLRFFPEGGELIAGSNGRVALEAVNEFGKGADVAGIITNERGRAVSTFESFHMGMGAFNLLAEKGHQYTARITRPLGIDEAYPLPIVKPDGLGLSIEVKTDSTLVIKVFSSYASQAYLVGHVHSEVYVADKLQLREGWNDVAISTQSMPAGIITFTLFNGDGVEMSERLAFINKRKTLQIEITPNRKEYLPGEKVELTLKTSNPSGVAVPANLSLAVVDDQLLTLADDKQDNMLSWLLLGSELKGKIEEPSFYFDEEEPKAKLAMDYLLMVHGWRRFTWKEVFTSNQTLTYVPENDRNLNGFVLDVKSKSHQAEVVLMELSNRKRIAKVRADKSGQFLFRNIDASSPMILLTKKPNTIDVNGVRSTSYESINRYYDYRDSRYYRINPVMEIEDQSSNAGLPTPIPSLREEVDIDLSADAAQLSEVVVTGQGISYERKALGYSTTRIVNELPASLYATHSIEPQLSGRVAGVIITQTSQPGSGANLQIRGMSSLSNQAEPLWVIDGVPVAGSINTNFSIGSQLTPGNIKSISVLKAAEGAALFGSAATNGVILVETKTRADHSNFNYVQKKPKYSVLAISPRTFTVAREFYTEPTKEKESRTNFKTTVFWKHSVVTDKNGEAKIQFYNNDAVSTFRITAEGISGSGLIGRKETTYHTLLPFSLDAKLPNYLGFEDTLRLPIRITNNTRSKFSGTLSIEIPDQLRSLDGLKQTIEAEANQTVTIPISIIPAGITGSFPISIEMEGNRHRDKVSQVIEVHPVGFPVRVSYSGKSLNKTINIPMSDVEKGSVKGEIVFVTDVLDDLFTGTEAMLREPHGCFEQVSSSTFPNILALQFLRETGRTNSQIETRAKNYIELGYKKLSGYEIRTGGFEWFGKPPAHLGLTAYGLLEFKEMKKVYQGVSDKMIERTRNWLLSQRNGDGTFKRPHDGYDGFSQALPEIINAYVVYAFSEAGFEDLQMEYDHSLAEALQNKDLYVTALMANAAANFKKTRDFDLLKTIFIQAVATNGFEQLSMKSSVTQSYGKALRTETLALWSLALMKASNPDLKLIGDCIAEIGKLKSFGMYYSTQATYLALKAVTEFHKLANSKRTDGEIVLAVNGLVVANKTYGKDDRHNIIFNEFANKLQNGRNELKTQFLKTNEALPFSVNLVWNTKTPQSNPACKLKVETALVKSIIKLNETIRMKIRLINISNDGLPMSMAVVGIPAGLNLQAWQLKELKEKDAIDFYEIIGDKLVIYYRELGPSQTKEINLDLKADLPGSFLSTASCAYLYYASEFKDWTEGTKVRVVR